jgi:hypothetical protein
MAASTTLRYRRAIAFALVAAGAGLSASLSACQTASAPAQDARTQPGAERPAEDPKVLTSSLKALRQRYPDDMVVEGNVQAALQRVAAGDRGKGLVPLCVAAELLFIEGPTRFAPTSICVFGYDADRTISQLELFVPAGGRQVWATLLPYGRDNHALNYSDVYSCVLRVKVIPLADWLDKYAPVGADRVDLDWGDGDRKLPDVAGMALAVRSHDAPMSNSVPVRIRRVVTEATTRPGAR